MHYSEDLLEEIRTRCDIVDVISGYVRLQRKGNSHFGLCPFHGEKTPSFSVSGSRQMYHCFGCGAGGNVFTFIMEYESFSFPEAIRALAERAGVTLPEPEYSEEARQKEGRRARLLEVNKAAAKFYYYQLRAECGKSALRFLLNRGLTEETMHSFGLGYAPQAGNALTLYLKSKGYDETLIREAGLSTFHEKHGTNDRFWNRVIFPIQDINHRVIAFGGRVMGEGEPKYLNSPESLIFDKSRHLYGLNVARTARKGHLILCEGYIDVISLHQVGMTNAVASMGTAFTAAQAGLCRRYTDELLLAYDSDAAGEKAALRVLSIIRESALGGRVIDLSPHKDPDDVIKKEGAEGFVRRMEAAENGFFYEIRVLEKSFDQKDPGEKTRFHREIAKKICALSEAVERDNYLAAICERYHINTDSLKKLVASHAINTGLAKPVTRPRAGTREKDDPAQHIRRAERALLTWLSEDVMLYKQIEAHLCAADFSWPLNKRVAAILFEALKMGKANPAAIISQFSDEDEQREVAAIFNTRLDNLDTPAAIEKAINDIFRMVKANIHELNVRRSGDADGAIDGALAAIAAKKALDELPRIKITH